MSENAARCLEIKKGLSQASFLWAQIKEGCYRPDFINQREAGRYTEKNNNYTVFSKSFMIKSITYG